MSHIEITHSDAETGGTRVVIDGTDLSRSITSLSVEIDGGARPRVTVDLLTHEDFRLCSPDAELIIGSATTDLLEKHGWTRPGVAR